jgi:myo-inositol-1(or 4)-monophosphatase
MSFFGGEVRRWEKAPGDPVSEADLAVDAALTATLRAARPQDGLVSEETATDPDQLARSRIWIIDPIDGTRAFLKGKPHFTVCAALLVDGVTRIGAVFNPATDELFAAGSGAGATLNGAPIRASDRWALEGCRMLGDAGMFRHPAWSRPWPDMEIETRNSIAYRIALVAGGGFDATLALSAKRDWDLAAAALIASEAGARITDHRGEPLRFLTPGLSLPAVAASGANLHPLLIERTHAIRLP